MLIILLIFNLKGLKERRIFVNILGKGSLTLFTYNYMCVNLLETVVLTKFPESEMGKLLLGIDAE